MQTGRDTITIRQDSSDIVRWLFEVNGVPMNFTGYDGRLQVRVRAAQDADLLAELTVNNGLLHLGADGVITADFNADTMSSIPPGAYAWDLRLIDLDLRPDYPLAGAFEVPASVTDELVEEPAP